MSSTMSARPLPVPREDVCPFGPAPEVAELRAQTPVARVTCPTGLEAWLVTRYADVREVLGDPRRFSSRSGAAGHILANMPPDSPVEQGDFFKMDGPEHVRFRRVFAPAITTVRRIEEFRPMVRRTADELLDGLAGETGPIDLHERFSKPLTSSVIAELLGVPYADRAMFQRVAETLFSGETDVDELNAVRFPLYDYVADLARARRSEPGEDVLSVLVTRGREHQQPFNDLELTKMAVGLLVAGYDTTASSITYGVLALLANQAQFDRLAADPALAAGAAEELLRLLSVGAGLLRVATEDTEIAGQPIAAGEYVVVAVQAANHDPAQFPEPETLDIERRTTSHLGFGHGPHQCVGQQIARLELTTALATLPQRVPTLRLAVPQEEIRFKADTTVYGPTALPVTWDEIRPA
ncbi:MULTISPECIES: cytochrome P450 [unclassified Crossiella]|uniref:cytochrome P450 n=1 Tax=unclassified Crossiella TaxID=2620835 RepID=UPI001FFF62E8|nr:MULTISPECIES: cytochrome P450 [unclassified Crossiella]MCK2244269.1 cytochrome P450 [Crossiella sp. S99.2]MCK2258073.1 cytochrome P450 [Crossiella sp. S99.1]